MKKFYRNISKCLIALVLGLIFFVAAPETVSALNSGTSITVSPVVDRPAITAGQTTDGEFTILNDGKTDYTFDVYAKPYTVSGLTYNQDFAKETNYTQIARWIAFPQTSYKLKRGESVKVKYQIKTPASIPDGSQYAVIFAQTRAPENQSGIASSQRVGILIYAQPTSGKTITKGNIVQQNLARVIWQLNTAGDVTAQSVKSKLSTWYQAAPVAMSAQIKNSGNTDFDAKSYLEIKNLLDGKKAATTATVTATILPDTTRQIDNVWCNSDAAATGQDVYNCDAPLAGLFQVTQHISFLNKDHAYTKTVLILPWWIVTAVGAIIVAIILAWHFGRRRGRGGRRLAHGSRDDYLTIRKRGR